MQRPPAAIVRYTLCLVEVLIVSGASAGCEALLGWWKPSRPAMGVEEREEVEEEERVSVLGWREEGRKGGRQPLAHTLSLPHTFSPSPSTQQE